MDRTVPACAHLRPAKPVPVSVQSDGNDEFAEARVATQSGGFAREQEFHIEARGVQYLLLQYDVHGGVDLVQV